MRAKSKRPMEEKTKLLEAGGSTTCYPGVNHFVLKSALVSSLLSVLLGYDLGVLSGAIDSIKDHMSLDDTKISIIVASLNFVSAVGALYAGGLCDQIGRRKTMMVASIVFAIGAVLMACAVEFWSLLLGRVVTGFG